MDDLTCSGEVVHQTLREIDTINRLLGGNSVTIEGIRSLLTQNSAQGPLHILDIGCGSGDMLKLVHQELNNGSVLIETTGLDANPHIIAYAQENCQAFAGMSFFTENVLEAPFRKRDADIVTATLFLHHFTNDQLVEILKTLVRQVRVGIVINDLHRHPLAYYGIKLLTQFFSSSSMVRYDAPLSVLRGFTRKEWVELLRKAGITIYSLKWRWAFRWQVIIRISE